MFTASVGVARSAQTRRDSLASLSPEGYSDFEGHVLRSDLFSAGVHRVNPSPLWENVVRDLEFPFLAEESRHGTGVQSIYQEIACAVQTKVGIVLPGQNPHTTGEELDAEMFALGQSDASTTIVAIPDEVDERAVQLWTAQPDQFTEGANLFSRMVLREVGREPLRVPVDQRAARPQNEKPLIVRTPFQDEEKVLDSLQLSGQVNQRLNETVARDGEPLPILFIDADDFPNAYQLAGRYRRVEATDQLKVTKLVLEKPGRRTTFAEVFCGDPATLVTKIVSAVMVLTWEHRIEVEPRADG